MEIGKDKLLWMHDRMRLIREFEQHLHEDFAAGNIPGFVHLYAGEEAVAVGAMLDLADRLPAGYHHAHVRTIRETFLNRPGQIYRTPEAVIVHLEPFAQQNHLIPLIDTINAEEHRLPLAQRSSPGSVPAFCSCLPPHPAPDRDFLTGVRNAQESVW